MFMKNSKKAVSGRAKAEMENHSQENTAPPGLSTAGPAFPEALGAFSKHENKVAQ